MKTLIIYGPTTTGKTALAINICNRYQGTIVSFDSRQVYVGLDIGTGKVKNAKNVKKQKENWQVDGIDIFGFDLRRPGQDFSVADFLKYTSLTLPKIRQQKKLPVFVGGTGFYLKALINGLDTAGLGPNPKLREVLQAKSAESLLRLLTKLNPQKARKLNPSDKKNPRRLVRAIEISKSNKTSSITQKLEIGDYFMVGLTAPNEYLYERADDWLSFRLKSNLIGEIENLLNNKVDKDWLIKLGLEYRWLTLYLTGKISKQEAIMHLKGDIHSFIRRQKTWFNKFSDILICDISKKNWDRELEKSIDLWYTRQQ